MYVNVYMHVRSPQSVHEVDGHGLSGRRKLPRCLFTVSRITYSMLEIHVCV